jgi:short-subunit dehydrogenase
MTHKACTALITFSETLQLELHNTGMRVQARCPGFTRGAFHDAAAFDTLPLSWYTLCWYTLS